MSALEANLRHVQERMAAAARRVGRSPTEVDLVVVTKTQPPEALQAVYNLGIRHFGENRVEEAEAKAPLLPADITWHMIGHIQSRKAKRIVPVFQMVHSVDSVDLARRLSRLCSERTEPLPVLIECNVSGEESKHGFPVNQWSNPEVRKHFFSAVEEILDLPQLEAKGMMTMAPIVSDPEQARPVFARLCAIRDSLMATFPGAEWLHLSMGMTDDFEVAIEEGATLIRVGRAVFAPDRPSWRKG